MIPIPLHKKPVNSRQKLWRYLTYTRLKQVVEGGTIYFSNITQMEDKWEGLLTQRTRERFWNSELKKYNENPAAANGAVRQHEEFRKDFYITCWNMNDHES